MDGKTLCVITWVSMNASRSFRKNVASRERVITGQLIPAQSTCLKMKEVCVAGHEDFDENNKTKTFQVLELSTQTQVMMARQSTSPTWTAIHRRILTNITPPLHQCLQLHQRFIHLTLLGSISKNTLEILLPRSTLHLNPVYWITPEVIKHTRRLKLVVSLKELLPQILSRNINHKSYWWNLRLCYWKSVRVFVSQQFDLFPSRNISLKNFLLTL